MSQRQAPLHDARIVLSNSYGTRNVGDNAILEVMVEKLRQWGCEVTILTFSPSETRSRYRQAHAVRSGVIRGLWSTWRAIRRADLLVVGGGGILQDATSLGNLLFHLSRPVLAILAGTPFSVCGVGVGPLRHDVSRRLTAAVCRRAKWIFVRDEVSALLLRTIGVPVELVSYGADLATLYAEISAPSGNEGIPPALRELLDHNRPSSPIVGISMRPLVGRRTRRIARPTCFQKQLSVFAEVLDELVQRYDAHVVFVSMHAEQDDPLADELRGLMRRADRFHVLSGSLPTKAIQAVIGRLDLVIGMRLHSLVFAALSAVPFVALAYDPKVANFAESLDASEQVLYPDQWTPASMIALVDDILARRAAIRESLLRNFANMKTRAQDSLIRSLQVGLPDWSGTTGSVRR